MHSVALINAHFWFSTIGTVLYIASMWVNGIMQGLMWRAYNSDGTLTYSFAESVLASYPGYYVRLIGGAMLQRLLFPAAANLASPELSLVGELTHAALAYLGVFPEDAVDAD